MKFKEIYNNLIKRFKELKGGPHYIAMGMAIGVFVGITPTIPFHTILAIALAFLFKGSKAAAAISVWVSNPLTIPVFYIGSYKIGKFFFRNLPVFGMEHLTVPHMAELGVDVLIAMLLGGVILGIMPAIGTYFFSKRAVIAIRMNRVKRKIRKETARIKKDREPEPESKPELKLESKPKLKSG